MQRRGRCHACWVAKRDISRPTCVRRCKVKTCNSTKPYPSRLPPPRQERVLTTSSTLYSALVAFGQRTAIASGADVTRTDDRCRVTPRERTGSDSPRDGIAIAKDKGWGSRGPTLPNYAAGGCGDGGQLGHRFRGSWHRQLKRAFFEAGSALDHRERCSNRSMGLGLASLHAIGVPLPACLRTRGAGW